MALFIVDTSNHLPCMAIQPLPLGMKEKKLSWSRSSRNDTKSTIHETCSQFTERKIHTHVKATL